MVSVEQLTETFEANKGQLKSYILRMTASVEDAEDIIQDTYIKAHKGLDNFKGKSSLKTWLFTIATNTTKDLLKSQKLWPENVTDICRDAALSNQEFLQNMMQVRMTSPHGNFEIKEHITFCFTCIGKSLPIEQQVTLLLKEIYEFKVSEIATILDKTEGVVKHLLVNSRKKMTTIFDSRCSLINKEGICHQCSELNGIFNPKQDFEIEKMKIDMVKHANDTDREYLFDLRAEIIKGIDPYNSGASELQLLHLQHNKKVMDNHLEKV